MRLHRSRLYIHRQGFDHTQNYKLLMNYSGAVEADVRIKMPSHKIRSSIRQMHGWRGPPVKTRKCSQVMARDNTSLTCNQIAAALAYHVCNPVQC